MIPSVGDIYCVYSDKLQQYVACQITMLRETDSKRNPQLAAVLELDWTGDRLPDGAELHTMKPLVCDFYFWNHRLDHSFVGANVPPNYTLVGNIPPLVQEETNSYSGGWHVGGSLHRQRNWEKIDPGKREQFKAAANDDTLIEIGGQSIRRDTSKINDTILQVIDDMSELDKLPCLMTIHTDNADQALIHYVNSNPLIHELQLASCSSSQLDLRNSHVSRLILNAEGIEELYLNEDLEQLMLSGTLSLGLAIHAHEDGRWMGVQYSADVPTFHGLDRLNALSLTNVKEINMQQIVVRFPHLYELRIWGKPGIISNLHSLEQLKELHRFTTYDLFGFTGEEFPAPDRLPHLSMLWMTSLPTDAGKLIKAAYKKEVPRGLDLSITKARKPEWLAENLDNPFRDWDGREQITAANAKKSAQLYKKMLATVRTLDEQMGIDTVNATLKSLVTEYTEAFNKMDRRTGFIETVEREEIYMVLAGLLDQVEQQLGEQRKTLIDRDPLFELFDQLRDF
ncbi:hypothetical protein [Paenibacillus terrae]|uniref:Gliding motility protein n=1 Tax=Paenibacillus terrae TaxID=159743 RepID=A0A0D7X1C9_9BACL|nr:hypothetical protein [Paenibacillus terrae]KJD45069.1 hypothetical protein QD47_13825 [Paenibacillus terrae]